MKEVLVLSVVLELLQDTNPRVVGSPWETALEWIWITRTFAEDRNPNTECDTERKPPPIWLQGCCLGKLTRVCTKASRVHAATPVAMADVLLHWPKGLKSVYHSRCSPGAHEAEISRHEELHWSEVPSCPPTPSLHPSPGSHRLLWACLGFLTYLWENIPWKKLLFLLVM